MLCRQRSTASLRGVRRYRLYGRVAQGVKGGDVDQTGGIQALLLGGRADGRAVRLNELHRQVVVYVDANSAFQWIVASEDRGPSGGTVYRLVEALGPDMPVYVASYD
jgi:hypothetical protein